ncbi:MAG: nucleotidyltransferase domain-containing protein [Bacteroidetes bacterium]|nr:nucleotidyltransferase domain-containing protein [Bacteroidota bacterium]
MDETIIEKIILLADKAKSFLNFEKVILYGSYSRGDIREYSDIDVAFIVDEVKGNYLDLSAKLYELVDNIDNRIEPIILNKNYDRSGFLSKVLKEGKVIYSI